MEKRIGIDLGGTKIEGVLMGADGNIDRRLRKATAKDDYWGTLQTVADIVSELEQPAKLKVGICTPGSISKKTGLMRNSNSVCLNNMPVKSDLETLLGRELRLANDANCLAVSEATDGAAAGEEIVFAVITGTGTGGGIAINGKSHDGRNYLGGEWGHMPLPWRDISELPGPRCYCGQYGCNETYISGTGLENDFAAATGKQMTAVQIVDLAANGDQQAEDAVVRYEQRLARALAVIVNFLDPDVIVLGGGMSNLDRLYTSVPKLILPWIFGGDYTTPIRRAKHGDSSGVRGAAWLWNK